MALCPPHFSYQRSSSERRGGVGVRILFPLEFFSRSNQIAFRRAPEGLGADAGRCPVTLVSMLLKRGCGYENHSPSPPAGKQSSRSRSRQPVASGASL